MINLYPLPNANNPALGLQLRQRARAEAERRRSSTSGWTTISPAKDSMFARFSYDQAASYVPGGSPGFAEASPFASNAGHHQPRPQRGGVGNARFFPEHGQSDQRRLQPDFRLHHVPGHRELRSADARHSGRQSGRRQLRSDVHSDGRRLLVAGRSRIRPISGRHQRFLHLRFLRHDSRQPRHQRSVAESAPTR